MREFDDDETLRLPVADYRAGRRKLLEDMSTIGGWPGASPAGTPGQEEYFFDFDTIPRSKVVLPVLDGLEDTLVRIPAVRSPSLTAERIPARPGTWITTDGRIVIYSRILRMFGFGFSSVLIGVTLATAGLSLIQVSLLLTIALVGSVLEIFFVTLFADRIGRRRVLICFALLMALSGLAFALSQNLLILLLAAFFGTINPSSTNENTPFIAIEQAILPQTCRPERLPAAFTRYNLWAQLAGAVGGLAVAFPDLLHSLLGIATSSGVQVMFAVYALIGLVTAGLSFMMTEKVESETKRDQPKLTRPRRALQKKSRTNVYRISSLFFLDAFAGGLVVQTIAAFWFRQRFGISLSVLGLLFGGANLAAALSLPVAARLSKRFGLLKTMVFTHLPSQLLLVLIPLMPTFWLAALFLLCRQSLSKMDVPTRQVFLMEMVSPEERTAAAGFTTMARSIATSMSPLAAGALLANSLFILGLPFLVAGGLSSLYDILLYILFRKVPVSKDS